MNCSDETSNSDWQTTEFIGCKNQKWIALKSKRKCLESKRENLLQLNKLEIVMCSLTLLTFLKPWMQFLAIILKSCCLNLCLVKFCLEKMNLSRVFATYAMQKISSFHGKKRVLNEYSYILVKNKTLQRQTISILQMTMAFTNTQNESSRSNIQWTIISIHLFRAQRISHMNIVLFIVALVESKWNRFSSKYSNSNVENIDCFAQIQ